MEHRWYGGERKKIMKRQGLNGVEDERAEN